MISGDPKDYYGSPVWFAPSNSALFVPLVPWMQENLRFACLWDFGFQAAYHVLFNKDYAFRLEEAWDAAQKEHPHRIHFTYGFSPRKKNNQIKSDLSTHAYGLAVDINPDNNPVGERGAIPDAWVRIFKDNGFTWGGDWGRPDPMHFQAVQNY